MSVQIKKQKSDQSKLRAAIGFINTFFEASSIHGFAHLNTSQKRHPVEILLWIVTICMATYYSINLSGTIWERYQENPTVISMERDRFSWNTSFPAATICPSSKLNDILVDEYITKHNHKHPNATLLRHFLYELANASYETFYKVPEYPDSLIHPNEYMKLIVDLGFEFDPSVSNSGAQGYHYTLQKVIAELGICYSFNSQLAAYNHPNFWWDNRWSLVKGNETFFVHPLDGEVFANIVNMSTGFDIFLHGPEEVVDVASKKIHSDNGYFLQVYLTGLTLFSTDRAKELNVHQRKCRFYSESNLLHSPVYSYTLCRMECRIRIAKEKCGCMPHFYRKLQNDVICNVTGMHCLAKHADTLKTVKKLCNCYPNCDEVNYVVEDLDSREWFLGSNLQWGLKEYPRMRLKRDVLFGFSDVLVYVGGMFGLFLGCSVLSFIEMFYFFTIRMFWFTMEYGKKTNEMLKK